ncbi:MAG: hypothetical protein NTU63_03050 [Candidatus Pacearchaeota archaeon]|nr:hypothetical protein [Candidatus Pacearchaeota archaeon]
MKRGWVFLFLFILIVLFLISFIIIKNLPKKTEKTGDITGKASAQTTDMSIYILPTTTAILSIISPQNETYFNGFSIPLNYSASGQQAVWYNLNSGTNITLSSPFYFNATDGGYMLYLYANNTYGDVTEQNVSFFVNSTRFQIIHEEWKGTKKGNSTNFTILSYEDVQNLSGIILENTNSGKILFNENINMTADENFNDNQVDLDTNANISSNRIALNSTALPNFNKKVTLWLYGLTFSDARILIDGEVCPSFICTKENYSGGTLKFNVTQFSVSYSAEENTTEVTVVTGPGGGGGGGGGGGKAKISDFSLSEDEIKVKLQQGHTTREQVLIVNTGDKELDVEIGISKIEQFVFISEKKFKLAPKESRVIPLEIMVQKETIPNLYIGEINVTASGQEKRILTIIEVESAEPIFDATVKIPQKYSYVMPGEDLLAEMEIYNLGEIEKEVDVFAEYKIMDWKGNEILTEREDLAVQTKLSYVKEFKIPETAAFGRYVIYITITYNGKVASSSVLFNVGKAPTIPLEIATIALAVFMVLFIIIIMIRKRKVKKQGESDYKIDKNVLLRANLLRRGR